MGEGPDDEVAAAVSLDDYLTPHATLLRESFHLLLLFHTNGGTAFSCESDRNPYDRYPIG